ncbi:hypothetical protein CC78DRAFT_607909 [Lojkania enalia]|uniref:Uncharacterized protein n=1 Tax=Lojkania enalia TaxID=147567 RepID=A0A9P4N8C5_9PLEO|nr:hypothetical protein CC78DRAFT_607909 [Didymosphaeria enalia]
MKDQPPLLRKLPLCLREGGDAKIDANQGVGRSGVDEHHEHTYFDDTLPPPNELEPRDEIFGHDSNASIAQTNVCSAISKAVSIPNARIDITGAFPRDPRSSPLTPPNRRDAQRGSENSAEMPGVAATAHSFSAKPPATSVLYKKHPLMNGLQSGMAAQMQTANRFTISPNPLFRAVESKYTAFQGAFHNSESARQYRKIETRFNRKPYRPPNADDSIDHIRNDRQRHAERIYNAMIHPDAAKDNANSIAMRRWVHSAYYPSQLVEAYAHKILDCLIELAEKGFRGWNHNDYALDERKGEDEDKDATCAERLANIIRGLEEEKTICEDVMNSACQIRMFVNAPRAYAQRKLNNRVGNSKRGRGKKDTDEPVSVRGAKRPLTTEYYAESSIAKRATNHRNERPALKNLAPNVQEQRTQRSVYPTPPPPLAPTSALPYFRSNAFPPAESNLYTGNTSLEHHLVMPMSPPQRSVLAPRFTSTPHQNTPLMSPPLYSRIPMLIEVENHKHLRDDRASGPQISQWPSNEVPSEPKLSTVPYPPFPQDEGFHDIFADHWIDPQTNQDASISTNATRNLEQEVIDPVFLDARQATETNSPDLSSEFRNLWESLDGVHSFSFSPLSEYKHEN